MTLSDNLKTAFQYHHRKQARAHLGIKPGMMGIHCIALARQDVTSATARYPDPIRQQYRSSESDGLRYVGRVIPENRHGNLWDSRGDCGWYTDPHGHSFNDGSGLCFGVVYQLPGRNGESRFVGGYEFGGVDGGPCLDLGAVFTEPRGDYMESACDLDAARKAARHADSLAKVAAEAERDYQAAWGAGSAYAQEQETVETARAELLAILKERRAVKGKGDYPALCAAIRSSVSSLLSDISTARETRAKLIAGDSEPYWFFPQDDHLRAAFCEGAGLDSFPA